MKATLACLSFFLKLIFFGTLIVFLEPTIKFLQEYLISKSNNNSYQDGTGVFFSMFFPKKTRTLMPLRTSEKDQKK